MGKNYICLACGNYFVVHASSEKKCLRCGSANIMKLSLSSISGDSAGGGG